MELYTVSEAARLLKVDPRTVRRKLEAGIIPHIKLGTLVRIRKEDVDEILRFGYENKPMGRPRGAKYRKKGAS